MTKKSIVDSVTDQLIKEQQAASADSASYSLTGDDETNSSKSLDLNADTDMSNNNTRANDSTSISSTAK